MGNTAPGGSVISHAFGQYVIDAWASKKLKDSEMMELVKVVIHLVFSKNPILHHRRVHSRFDNHSDEKN